MEVTITNKPPKSTKNRYKDKGDLTEKVKEQRCFLTHGCPKVELVRPATPGDGILALSEDNRNKIIQEHGDLFENKSFVHFIPASGAGSRMLKALIAFAKNFDPEKESFSTYINRTQDMEVFVIFNELKAFPFYGQLKKVFMERPVESFDVYKLEIAHYILYSEEIGLASRAKGLIPFHSQGKTALTAFESQLQLFCKQTQSIKDSSIHFTIDIKYQQDFLIKLQHYKKSNPSGCLDHKNIGFSYQNPNTNTVALNTNNKLVTLDEGQLFTRPAGHGCLLENLQELEDKDIVYISNIDNIAASHVHEGVIQERKLIQSICLKVRSQISYLLNNLTALNTIEMNAKLNELAKFINMPNFSKLGNTASLKKIRRFFNRPLRVCGMVINEGEAGGGPFWILDNDNTYLQIVEGVEVDIFNTVQKEISLQSTHFNPVEIALSIKDYNGGTFSLEEFKKEGYAITCKKSIEGREITALERHGLWNGSMLNWLTIFVEIKPEVFNPVKRLSDLTKSAHQAQ